MDTSNNDREGGNAPVLPPVYFGEETRYEPMEEGSNDDQFLRLEEPMDDEHEITTEDENVDDPLRIVDDICYCVICKERADKDITEYTAVALAKQLKKIDDDGVLSAELKDRLLRKGESYLVTVLKSGGFKLHKRCYDRFNDSKLNRAKSAGKRKKSNEGESSRVTRAQCTPSVVFGEQLCMYCGKSALVDPKHCENSVPLHAAGGKHISSEYVDTFTESLRTMAAKLGDTKLQNLLGGMFVPQNFTTIVLVIATSEESMTIL